MSLVSHRVLRGWASPQALRWRGALSAAVCAASLGRCIADFVVAKQADSLTEEQVSEFKEAFSLFVSPSLVLDFPAAGFVDFPIPVQDKDGDGKSLLDSLRNPRRITNIPAATANVSLICATNYHDHSTLHYPFYRSVKLINPVYRPDHYQGIGHCHALLGPEPLGV